MPGSGVLAALRRLNVPFASSLTAALLDGLSEQPAMDFQ
jgi:hypothetical protein